MTFKYVENNINFNEQAYFLLCEVAVKYMTPEEFVLPEISVCSALSAKYVTTVSSSNITIYCIDR
jgi:hypothetical protein